MDKKKKIITAILASVSGISGAAVAGAVLAYDAFFPRYDRPDYELKPGMYCYERFNGSLQRELISFKSKKNTLQAYYYPSVENKGLIVFCPGMHAGADDYLPAFEYLVGKGFSVFSFDYTGVYDSTGSDTVGMCQSLIDTDNAIKFIKEQDRFKGIPLFVMGHSWGGYAASSVLSIHKDIRAMCGIAPMNNGFTLILEKGQQYAGKMGTMPKPALSAYQKILFGDYTKYNGVKGINESNVPVVIAQGVEDKIITYDGQSITAKKSEITNPNVTYYIGKELLGDHCNVWHSINSSVYQLEVDGQLKLLEIEKGDKLTREEKVEFYKTVDHRLYSEVNVELFDLFIETFNKTL